MHCISVSPLTTRGLQVNKPVSAKDAVSQLFEASSNLTADMKRGRVFIAAAIFRGDFSTKEVDEALS